jgi:hypothetical protein
MTPGYPLPSKSLGIGIGVWELQHCTYSCWLTGD